jgi:pSer/pThr/pTyr-binding forkhead associated (FHA) protein
VIKRAPDEQGTGHPRASLAAGDGQGAPAATAQHPGSWVADSAVGAVGRLLLLPVGATRDAIRVFLLDGNSLSIGRDPACAIALPDDTAASRLHAMVRCDATGCVVSDLGSSNGTLVNGVAITGEMLLNEGDRITVGNHALFFTRRLLPLPSSQTHEPAGKQPTPSAEEGGPNGAHGPGTETLASNWAASGSQQLTMPPSATDTPVPLAPGTLELEQTQAQLAEAPSVPEQMTASTARDNEQVVARLAEIAARVASSLASAVALPPGHVPLDQLMRIADAAQGQQEQALAALQTHAGAIASALRRERNLVSILEYVQDELADLARQEEW